MKNIISKAVYKITSIAADEIEKVIEIPKDSSLGDYALPCFFLSRKLKKNPAEIALELSRKLQDSKVFDKVNAVGPYVNFFVNKSKRASEVINQILSEGDKYGSLDFGKGKTFMIEFSQPNTHKAFHVGHIRGTCFGESVARIREFCNYNSIRVNYSGDTGMHIAKWIWAYRKFHAKEKIKSDESWFAKIYVEAVEKLEENLEGQEEVEEINRKLDSKEDKTIMRIWKETRTKSISAWKPIYKDLDVKFDKHIFESQVENSGKEIAKSLIKNGIAEISEGATIMDLKNNNLGVWVLLRKDGTVLYSSKDLALAEMKFKEYKMDESLVITSVEQNLHFQQLRKTLELMGFPRWKSYMHLGYESVRFPWGKMSSRTGDNIFYADFRKELVEEAKKEITSREKVNPKEVEKRALTVAVAAMKYSMLKQDVNKIIIFNKDEALRFEGDTGPYLLYSYARAKSILNKVKSKKSNIETNEVEDSERLLVNLLSRFQEVVETACKSSSPAGLAHYSYELAQSFNEFYHKCPVVGSEKEAFRIALVKSTCQVLKNALYLLGIPVIDRM